MTLVEMLEREEGFVPHAYQDHLGYWTIGHGILIDEKKGGGITEEESRWLVKRRLATRAALLDYHIPWWRDLNRSRRDVVLGMAYQMGIVGLLKFKRTLARMESGDYKGAANGMRASLWARQTPGRAERMARAMESGRLK